MPGADVSPCQRRVSEARPPYQGTSAELKELTGADTLDAVFLSLTGHDTKEAAENDDLEKVFS